jgi:hypothetical protein
MVPPPRFKTTTKWINELSLARDARWVLSMNPRTGLIFAGLQVKPIKI